MKSEQITPNHSLILDYDQPLKKREEFLEVLRGALGETVTVERFQNRKNIYVYKHDGMAEYFLTGAITYLSKPHPLFKKRYQLKTWHKEFYELHKKEKQSRIHLLGVYHYDGLVVFVDFNTEDYIRRKLNSSAAHVFSNDLFQAVTTGLFEKMDRNGNRIAAVPLHSFKSYIHGVRKDNIILRLFDRFNSEFTFDKWITALSSIREMKSADWYQWRGTEWPGWFLEYKFSLFIEHIGCQKQMTYIGNIKHADYLDFDIFFPEKPSYYGDLKASDISVREAPGNDCDNLIEAIANHGRFWYVIYEHDTIKDTEKNNEMAIARMRELGQDYNEGDKISYKTRMKHSVRFRRMEILELNRVNMSEVLKEFHQGHQATGEKRAPKFTINKRNIDNFIVFSYEPQNRNS